MVGGTGGTTKVPIYGNRRTGGRDGQYERVITGYRDVTSGGGSMPAGWSQVTGRYIPQFKATQTLSPTQQAIFDKTQGAQINLADLAKQQSGFLKDYMKKPLDLSNEKVEARLFDLGRKRLDPMFAERSAALDQQLANQGIAIGSEAYNTAQRQRNEGQNDAYNQLLLSGRGQAIEELLTQRNQPINEIIGLLSGTQVQSPNSTFAPTNQPTIPTVDYAGLVNENFNQKAGIAQQKNAMTSNILGGLFGLGGNIIGARPWA